MVGVSAPVTTVQLHLGFFSIELEVFSTYIKKIFNLIEVLPQ